MNFVPSLTILAGILASLFLPMILLLLSHGPWKVRAPGTRFLVAATLTVVAWALFLLLHDPSSLADVFASVMLLGIAGLVQFSFWCLLAWGFTLSLLLALARAGRPLTFEQWVSAYSTGGNVETFTRDRLSLLLTHRMVWLDGELVRMTPGRGQQLARLVDGLRRLFGVEA